MVEEMVGGMVVWRRRDPCVLRREVRRGSEGPSEGIRRIRRGFPEEEPSATASLPPQHAPSLNNHSSTTLQPQPNQPQPLLNHPSCRIQERFRLNHPTSAILQIHLNHNHNKTGRGGFAAPSLFRITAWSAATPLCVRVVERHPMANFLPADGRGEQDRLPPPVAIGSAGGVVPVGERDCRRY